jgi:hypothetical protein
VCSPATQTCELVGVDAHGVDSPANEQTSDATTMMIDAAASTDGSGATPPLVQQRTDSILTGASLTVTLPAPPAAGHTLLMIGAATQGPLTSVSGGGVATWTLATKSTVHGNIEVWYGITDGSSAAVTIAMTGSFQPLLMSLTEWSGLATGANAIDRAQAANGTGTTAAAGAITTTHANDLVLFGVSDLNFSPLTFVAPTPGTWNALDPVKGLVSEGVWWQIASSTGTLSPSLAGTAMGWDAAVVAIRIAP